MSGLKFVGVVFLGRKFQLITCSLLGVEDVPAKEVDLS
jgi:hypothetical protein